MNAWKIYRKYFAKGSSFARRARLRTKRTQKQKKALNECNVHFSRLFHITVVFFDDKFLVLLTMFPLVQLSHPLLRLNSFCNFLSEH